MAVRVRAPPKPLLNKVAGTPTTVKASKVPAAKDLKSALTDMTEKNVAAMESPAGKKKDQKKDEATKKKAEPVKKTRTAAAKRKTDSKVEESSVKKLKSPKLQSQRSAPKKRRGPQSTLMRDL